MWIECLKKDREIDKLKKKNISAKNISTQVKYDRIVIQRLFRFNPPVYRKFFKDCSKLVVNAIFVVGRKTGLQIKNYEFWVIFTVESRPFWGKVR